MAPSANVRRGSVRSGYLSGTDIFLGLPAKHEKAFQLGKGFPLALGGAILGAAGAAILATEIYRNKDRQTVETTAT